MSYIKNFIDTIEEKINIDMSRFEPTDSEGWNLEGTVDYEGKTYYVDLCGKSEDSYERQAAIIIADTILHA